MREVRIIPKHVGYTCEIVYEKEIEDPVIHNSGRVLGIDLGVVNLATIANNFGENPIIVKGGVAKSVNQFYNKQKARLQSIYETHGIKTGKRIKILTQKRNSRISDVLHKLSRAITDYALEKKVEKIIIGSNPFWKQQANMGKKNNQKFTQLPHGTLISMIEYKAEEIGISVERVEESYTSKCSFLDNKTMKHQEKYLGKRVKRGLFRSATGVLLNADVNAAYNMIRKAIPNAFADGIEGIVLHPVSVNPLHKERFILQIHKGF